MAKDKSSSNVAQELLDIQHSDTYGVSPDFLRENRDIIERTKKLIEQKILSSGAKDASEVSRPNEEYAKILARSLSPVAKSEVKLDVENSVLNESGGYFVNAESDSDMEVIKTIANNLSDSFASMTEYQYAVELVPEIQKCIEMIKSDILSVDEFSNTIIKNVYKPNVESSNNSTVNEINKMIINLLQTYKFEDKLAKWIETALVKGAKPIGIYPSGEIIKESSKLIKEQGDEFSFESFIDNFNAEMDDDSKNRLDSPLKRIKTYRENLNNSKLSMESFTEGGANYETVSELNKFFDDIIDDDLRSEYKSLCLENCDLIFKKAQLENMGEIDKFNTCQSSLESLNVQLTKVDSKDERTGIDFNLKRLIEEVDNRIDIVDPKRVPVYHAARHLKKTKGVADENESTQEFLSSNNPYSDDDNEGKTIRIGEIDIPYDGSYTDEEIDKFSITKKPLLVEYDPQDVIPITVGSSHVGYYVVETREGVTSIFGEKNRKDYSNTFLSLVKQMTSDDEMVKGNSFYGPPANASPYLSGVFAPESVLNLASIPISTGRATGGGTESIEMRQIELLKKIIVKTLSKRLGNMDYADDIDFQNNILNIMKREVITKKRATFSFVHPSHMVYFNYKLDDNGMPVSILDGTLFHFYMYIASVLSSLMIKMMKSENRENLIVNMGATKNIGLTVKEIRKMISTRNIHAGTMFGGVASVLKSAASFRQNVIPDFDGEQLYQIEHDDKFTDISPDDDFTEKRLLSIVTKIGVPPSSLNLLEDSEFSRSVLYNRIDYRDKILDLQKHFSPEVVKAIRLISFYGMKDLDAASMKEDDDIKKKDRSTDSSDTSLKFSVDDITFQFSKPKSLSVDTLSEAINESNDTADAIVTMLYGEDEPEEPVAQAERSLMKQKLMQYFVNVVNWSEIEDIRDNAHKEAEINFLEKQKDKGKGAGEEEELY